MSIEDSEAAGTSEHAGRTYYFCSSACKERFDADPASFVGEGRR